MEMQNAKEFNKFDVVCYDTLQSINAKEASKAMVRAERMKKRKVGLQPGAAGQGGPGLQ